MSSYEMQLEQDKIAQARFDRALLKKVLPEMMLVIAGSSAAMCLLLLS